MAVVVSLSLALSACGNSSSDGGSTTTAPSKTGDPSQGGDATRDEFVEISGVPGVSDDEIAFAVIGTKTGNPLGNCILDCYLAGIEAYFSFRNGEGGIYGRDLVVGEVLDDELSQNQVKSLDVISGNEAFGVFNATLLATGWGDLNDAGVPTYTWGIHATEAANRNNIFPSLAPRCVDCTQPTVPYAAQLAGATKSASIGYGVSENSKVCTDTVGRSFDRFEDQSGVALAYTNDNLDYGLPNGIGPEVTAMKQAGVDFISTCIDLNGMKTLAQELERQGMGDVTLFHPNTYSQSFVAEAGDLFEGDIVSAQFRPFEVDAEGTALGDFLKAMEAADEEVSELAMVGWINASLAFEGLLAAGPDFDRASVLAATNAMTDFSADGLLQPIGWTKAHTPYTEADRDLSEINCAALVRVEDGAFVTVAEPDKPWLCWPDPDESFEPVPTSFE